MDMLLDQSTLSTTTGVTMMPMEELRKKETDRINMVSPTTP